MFKSPTPWFSYGHLKPVLPNCKGKQKTHAFTFGRLFPSMFIPMSERSKKKLNIKNIKSYMAHLRRQG
jgi:hypothetical protein